MDLRQLQHFVAVAEEGSVHAGARRLMIAQPQVSQVLRKLEREAGGELFIRSPRGVELTEAGAALLIHAREILARVDSAAESVRALTGAARQPLRVGLMAGIGAAADLTAPILSTYIRRHPNVAVEIQELTFAFQFEALVTGAVDVAIIREPGADERIETHPLFTEPRVLCCSAEHRVADADLLSIDDILDDQILELVRIPAPMREFWALNDSRGGRPPRPSADPAVTLAEVEIRLLSEPVLMPAAACAFRHSPWVRSIPLTGVAPSLVSVGYLRDRPSQHARDFVRCAREISERFIDLVPGGKLISA